MQELSTSDYLIKKLYGETEPTENQAIEEAFLLNNSLKVRYEELEKSKKRLDKLVKSKQEIAPESISRILSFSKLTAILNYKN